MSTPVRPVPHPAKIVELLLPRVRGNARGMMRLVELLRGAGDEAGAVDLCYEAMALAPDDTEVISLGRSFLASMVPGWHFNLIRDEPRTLAYEAALIRNIKPGMRVLEIGAGTGVLAMMAARAGAAHVYTCEANPAVARTAAEIVAANGFADRVTVLAKHSTAIDVDADLGGRADMLVSEIVSNDVLGEEVLPSHEHAIEQLLVPGAPVIPRAAMARVALADHDRQRHRLGAAYGFDFSAFNHLARAVYRVPIEDKRLRLLSDPADLFRFDISSGAYTNDARASIELTATGGQVTGVIQWLVLDLDEAGGLEAGPGMTAFSNWAMMFHAFPEPIETVPGQKVVIHGMHNRRRISIWGD